MSGDSTPLNQKERCPKRYPNLFFEGHFRGLSHCHASIDGILFQLEIGESG